MIDSDGVTFSLFQFFTHPKRLCSFSTILCLNLPLTSFSFIKKKLLILTDLSHVTCSVFHSQLAGLSEITKDLVTRTKGPS